ncbi:MAG TPA: hypothetical protein VFN76_09940 [Candidatus Limnocylindria bacterium]|nr:hypothetical protein [Candidatus Limnocylindria bacterium]
MTRDPAPDRDLPATYVGKLEPNYYCRGWNEKRQKYCGARAGWSTDHPGVGRCRQHDGGGSKRVTHGQSRRYANIRSARLRHLIAEHAADPDPLNIEPELAAARALFQDFVERYETNTAALLAWYASWQSSGRVPLPPEKLETLRAVLSEYEELRQGSVGLSDKQEADLAIAREIVDRLGQPVEGKPATVLDLSDAYRIVGEVTKIVERIEKIRSANAISVPDLNRLMLEMGRVVSAHVKDDAVANRIQEQWLAIRV